MTCPSCGAAARADASFCGQCHAAFTAVVAPAASGRIVPVAAAPSVEPVYSRWRGGPTALGPVGRVCWTIAVVLVAAFGVFSGSIFFIAIWIVIVGPLILRSVWKRERIR
jgi:hypothetical protein